MAPRADLLRVVMVVAQYPPVIGGTERACQRLSRALVERGVGVTVLTRRTAHTPPLAVEDGGVTVHRLPVPNGRVVAGLSFIVGAVAWLVRHREEYEIVHGHQLLSPATIGALARRLTGRPVLVKLACSGATGDVALIRAHRLAWLRRSLLRTGLDGFVCLNDEMETELKEWLGPVRTWRLGNGISADEFAPPPAAARDEIRRTLGFEGRVLLFTGALRAQKGLPLALDAVASLPPDVHLWIVGDGPERPSLERLVVEKSLGARIHLVGPVGDVRPYLHAADAYLLPSTAEGISNALLEAMAAGLPAIASDVPGNREVAGGGRCALLFRPGSLDDLMRSARDLLGDHSRARALAAVGQERVRTGYDLSSLAERYVSIYWELST